MSSSQRRPSPHVVLDLTVAERVYCDHKYSISAHHRASGYTAIAIRPSVVAWIMNGNELSRVNNGESNERKFRFMPYITRFLSAHAWLDSLRLNVPSYMEYQHTLCWIIYVGKLFNKLKRCKIVDYNIRQSTIERVFMRRSPRRLLINRILCMSSFVRDSFRCHAAAWFAPRILPCPFCRATSDLKHCESSP